LKYFIIVLFAVVSLVYSADSQVKLSKKKLITFSTGMGIDYGATPDFTDYLRDEIPYSNKDSINSFHAGIEFFGGIEYDLSQTISAKLDYSYYLRSINYSYSFFVFDYTIASHQPYLFINYLSKSDNYRFKFGLGTGYHMQSVDNKVNPSTTLNYKSSGVGVRGEVVFSPMFSKKFWGYISGFVFGNFYGKLKDDNGNVLKASNSTVEASLSGYGVGARLGFSIILN
jgi:hypothetical protein